MDTIYRSGGEADYLCPVMAFVYSRKRHVLPLNCSITLFFQVAILCKRVSAFPILSFCLLFIISASNASKFIQKIHIPTSHTHLRCVLVIIQLKYRSEITECLDSSFKVTFVRFIIIKIWQGLGMSSSLICHLVNTCSAHQF